MHTAITVIVWGILAALVVLFFAAATNRRGSIVARYIRAAWLVLSGRVVFKAR